MTLAVRLTLALGFLLLTACPHKVPLQENPAVFDVSSSHWFANEKTQYVFFRVRGLRTAQALLSWPFAFEISGAPNLKAGKDGFAALDLSKGVHRHHLVECGNGQICGSFSFHADRPVSLLTLRYRYNQKSPLNETVTIGTSTHPDDGTAAAQSALIYGVFNGDNSQMQVRVHDNFGDPDAATIAQFGMERTFEVRDEGLTTLTAQEMADAGAAVQSTLLYPATICQTAAHAPRAGSAPSWRFSSAAAWDRHAFNPTDFKNAGCFRVRALDKNGATLTENPAVGRRNPELQPQSLTLRPPLADAHKIPVVVSYCPNEPDSDSQLSSDFLDYQRFILGFPKAGVDVCFRIGHEQEFANELDRVLTAKLAQARAGNTDGGDYFFTVALHHNLDSKVHLFHDILNDKLTAKIGSEVQMVSPRLVGAFVYDSQSTDDRAIQKNNSIVWCPRKEKDGQAASNANCTASGAGDITFGPLNFLIPMGPFPTREAYLDYLAKYHHRGESNDPNFAVQSVQTNVNSVTDGKAVRLYTFFDGQRLSLQAGERLRFCRDRNSSGMLDSLAFKGHNASGDQGVLDVDGANILMGTEGASVDVGLWWDSPFYGGFTWNMPLTGKVFGLVPLSKTFKNEQKIGDPIWASGVWNVGSMIQKCERYCDNPYFDEAGVYQTDLAWNVTPTCPTPKIAEPK